MHNDITAARRDAEGGVPYNGSAVFLYSPDIGATAGFPRGRFVKRPYGGTGVSAFFNPSRSDTAIAPQARLHAAQPHIILWRENIMRRSRTSFSGGRTTCPRSGRSIFSHRH